MQSTSKWFKYSILNKILAGAPFSCQRERSARTGYRSLWGRGGDRCAGAAKIFLHSFARETQAVFPAVKLHNVTARAPKPKKAPRSVIIIAFGGAPDLSKKADRVVSARLARLCRLAWVRPRRIMDECAQRFCLVSFCRNPRTRPAKNSHKPRATFSVRLVRFHLLHRAIRAASLRKVTSKTPRGTCRRAKSQSIVDISATIQLLYIVFFKKIRLYKYNM